MRTTAWNLGLLSVVLLLCIGLASFYPVAETALAQDEPTDVPFPTSVATASPASTVEKTLEATAEVTSESSTALTLDDAVATSVAAQADADHLRTENKTLQDALASAQSDKGATLYALVIVVVGLLLAFAVFFGLRRSGS